MTTLTVSQLSIYPLKSASGNSLMRMYLGAMGPSFDRRWMVVRPEGTAVTQRQYPRMCLIGTALKNNALSLSAPGMPRVDVERPSEDMLQSEVWGSEVSGQDCGEVVAQWLSQYLGLEARLIYMADDYQRLVDQDYASNRELVGFADGFPLLICSDASLQNFNSHLNKSISMDRFRPNIVIAGCEPYAEDRWKKIRIAGIEITLAKPCSRCVMPSIDQQTGIKDNAVLDALNTYRRQQGKTYFGQNGLYLKQGVLKVGDAVQVLE